jgi:surface antigen
MQSLLRALPLVAIVALAGCSSMGTTEMAQGPTLAQPNPTFQTAPMQTPAQQTAAAQQMTDISAFVDAAVVAQLSANERAQAAGAQFNALQFGRPGAPRAWQGDKGASGNVTVGPYVRVNNIDCRDFTHTVKVGGKDYARKGMACREVDGSWTVVNAS